MNCNSRFEPYVNVNEGVLSFEWFFFLLHASCMDYFFPFFFLFGDFLGSHSIKIRLACNCIKKGFPLEKKAV